MKDKYKKLDDLYVAGTEVRMSEDAVIYLVPLNPFQVDEARTHAQAARSRIVLALREEDSDERAMFDAKFEVDGRETVIDELATAKANLAIPKLMAELEDDPDEEWQEKLEVLRRHDSLGSPNEEEERAVAKINSEYYDRLRQLIEREDTYEHQRLEQLDDESLRGAFREFWIDRRGHERSLAEYRVTELLYAARECEGVYDEDAERWDHSKCDSHLTQVWSTRDEVRSRPEGVIQKLRDAMDEMNMSVREGKDSGSPASSSDSSASTSEEVASKPSTPEEIPTEPPGTSSQPSPTR